MELMNQKAKEIGAGDTHFVTASGMPKGRQYTTARDLTIILKKALTYPLIREIIGKKEWLVKTVAGRELYLENTDDLLWSRGNMVGGKTGFTRNARHCFVGALDTGNGLIFTAVLGARSRSRLWESTQLLADLGTSSRMIGSTEEPLMQTQTCSPEDLSSPVDFEINWKQLSSIEEPLFTKHYRETPPACLDVSR